MKMPKLILIYETEETCRKILVGEGFSGHHAEEISSYLAQSTDLAHEFGLIGSACEHRGLEFEPVELDDAHLRLSGLDPDKTLVWTLTDGISYFRGSAGPMLARLNGLRRFGADDSLFSLCQDKFRSGAVLSALGLPVPAAGLACDGQWLVEAPFSPDGYFTKPNRLGAKIGIWPDSRCDTREHAMQLSRRAYTAYRDSLVVQPYVRGRNVRASFLAVDQEAGIEKLGVFFVDSGSDFQTMADSMALYGATGATASAQGRYVEPNLSPLEDSQPIAADRIREMVSRMMSTLGLHDVFSADFRVEADDSVHLIEFEVCPGLPCFDFRHYCRTVWGLDLAEAMAAAAANRFQA